MTSDVLLHPDISDTTLERIEAEFIRSDATYWPFDRDMHVPAALDPGGPRSELAGRRPTMVKTQKKCCD